MQPPRMKRRMHDLVGVYQKVFLFELGFPLCLNLEKKIYEDYVQSNLPEIAI